MAVEIRRQGRWEVRRVEGHPSFARSLLTYQPGSSLDLFTSASVLELPLLHHAWSGVAELEVDGHSRHTIDLFSPVPCFVTSRIELPGPADGPHHVRVRLTPGRNARSRGHELYVGTVLAGEEAALAGPAGGGAVRRLNDDVLFCRGREGDFLALARDTAVSAAIAHAGVWAPDDVDLFRRLVRPGDTALDVGANLGHHSVVLSRLVGPGGKVLSFEPQQYLFNLLCANLALNRCLNVSPQRLALGDRRGRVRMLPTSYDREGNSFAAIGISTLPDFQVPDGEVVPLDSLDGLAEEQGLGRLDFLKIDVQTFELFVLRGAVRCLERFRPRLFVEVAPYWMKKVNGYDYREVYSLLAGLGYVSLGKDLRPAPVREAAADDPAVEWDVVAVHRSDPCLRAARAA
jgi:FkbM family methyltransferase